MLHSICNGKRSAARFQYCHNGKKAILKYSLEKDLNSVNYSLFVIEYGEFVTVCYQYHWLGAYRTNALYSGHIFVRFNDLEDVFM